MKHCLLVLSLALALAACKKESGPPAVQNGGDTGAEPAAPVENTGGEPAAAPAGSYTCSTDQDCVVSCARPNECCDQLCEPCEQAFHKDELAAHEAWRQSCKPEECPVAKCMAPTEETFARCESGKCTVGRRALSATP